MPRLYTRGCALPNTIVFRTQTSGRYRVGCEQTIGMLPGKRTSLRQTVDKHERPASFRRVSWELGKGFLQLSFTDG